MKGFAALAMVATLAVSLLSFTNLGLAQGVSVSVEPAYTPGGVSKVLKVTLTNNTGSLANRVVIQVLKDGVIQSWNLTGVAKIPAGENVFPTDNEVYIAPDNIIRLNENLEAGYYVIPTTTELLIGRVAGYRIYVEKLTTDLILGTENMRVSPRENVTALENIENCDNLAALVPLLTALPTTDNWLVVAENIYAYWVNPDENLLAPVENAILKNPRDRENLLLVAFENRVKVTKAYDDLHLADNKLVALEARTLGGYNIFIGDNLQLMSGQENRVYLPAEQVIQVGRDVDIILPANLCLIRENDKTLIVENKDRVKTLPEGWAITSSGDILTYQGVTDNIPSGEQRTFEFKACLPAVSGTYTIRATLFYGDTQLAVGTVFIEIDCTAPSVQSVTASPTWAKKNENISLTFQFSETVVIDNVTLKERNGEETQLTLTPADADNKTWTTAYTTGENVERDGAAIISIKVKDRAGNPCSETWENVLFIDRAPPLAPKLFELDNWFPDRIVHATSQFVKASPTDIKDNYQNVENENTVENVMLRVGTSVSAMTKDIFGNWQYTVTFPQEGIYEVGIYAIDKAGNVGAENAENIVVDNTKPRIQITSPENNAIMKDNTPTLRVTISDLGVGLENKKFEATATENAGVLIELRKADGTLIEDFNPKDDNAFFTATVDNSRPNFISIITGLAFENEFTELPDNDYYLWVIAGDNFLWDNIYYKFTIDTTAPPIPSKTDMSSSVPVGDSVFTPKGTKRKTITVTGRATGDAVKVRVYCITDTTPTKIGEEEVTAGRWTVTVDLSAYKGRTVGLGFSTVDAAGNESSMETYGYLVYDDEPPKVTIDAACKQLTTDRDSVMITGKIEINSWETWDEITVSVSPSTASIWVEKPAGQTVSKFTITAPVTAGVNQIVVTATDGCQNSGSDVATVTKTVTPWATYATILVIIALVLAAVAIFRKK